MTLVDECNNLTAIEYFNYCLKSGLDNITDLNCNNMMTANITTINNTIGDDKNTPAQSCQEILEVRPDSKSGDYWLKGEGGSSVLVHCKMDDINGRKGMMQLEEMNMNNSDSQCPGELNLVTYPTRMCERASQEAGCSRAMFSTQGIPYKTVCGRINALQYGAPNAFKAFVQNNQLTIDDNYVDRVILSRINATGNRDHMWTFAVALDEVPRSTMAHVCPCTHNKTAAPSTVPAFVGEDYFCETGTVSRHHYGKLYTDDPLWDGKGCGQTSTCCIQGNYFCKTFDDAVSDDIELRLCADESRSNEDSPVTLLKLYIQ